VIDKDSDNRTGDATEDKFQHGIRLRDLPNEAIEKPCFVIFEDEVRHNLQRTAAACGGVSRLMPHVKTHRAPLIVELLLSAGVAGFKAATLA
jgi:D-serine deaminase-like pyridoxal phosphate-dependent protein